MTNIATAPRLVCAWCGVTLREGDATGLVSHGICANCDTQVRGSLGRMIINCAMPVPQRACARCATVHSTDLERALCSMREDV